MNLKKYWQNAYAHSRTYAQSRLNLQDHCNILSDTLNEKHYVYNAKKIFTQFRMVVTDQVRRSRFEQAELDDMIIKSILRAQRYTNKKRDSSRLSLYELKPQALRNYRKPRGTITRIRNRCVMTARSSIVGYTGLSRICFRRRASTGKIPGVFKI